MFNHYNLVVFSAYITIIRNLYHLQLLQCGSAAVQSTDTLHLRIAQCLVKHGADVTLKNKRGHTALELCPDVNIARILHTIQRERVLNNRAH
jgi:hypothetical protein